MVVKSHGPHRRTREKFRKSTRTTVNQYIREFSIGQMVSLNIESSSSNAIPFRRFQGLAGKIIGKRGRAYIVEITDGGKLKKIIANPEHLKAV